MNYVCIYYMVIFYSLEKKNPRNYDVRLPQMGVPSLPILPVLMQSVSPP